MPHTHVGYRRNTGYYATKEDGQHTSRPGKLHALNARDAKTFIALCGETVWLDDRWFDGEPRTPNVMECGPASRPVQCKRCRKLIGG